MPLFCELNLDFFCYCVIVCHVPETREDVDVHFPKCSKRSVLAENCYELEKRLKEKKWERERILDDIRREQALLDQEKYNFSLRKQEFLKFVADSSSYMYQVVLLYHMLLLERILLFSLLSLLLELKSMNSYESCELQDC